MMMIQSISPTFSLDTAAPVALPQDAAQQSAAHSGTSARLGRSTASGTGLLPPPSRARHAEAPTWRGYRSRMTENPECAICLEQDLPIHTPATSTMAREPRCDDHAEGFSLDLH
jgi:hypothetical protein